MALFLGSLPDDKLPKDATQGACVPHVCIARELKLSFLAVKGVSSKEFVGIAEMSASEVFCDAEARVSSSWQFA